MLRRIVWCVLSLAAVTGASPARADGRETARRLFERGTEALHAGQFPAARRQLRRSLELHPHPAAAFNLTVALRGMGSLVEARDACVRLLEGRYGKVEPSREKQAREMCSRIEEGIATLSIEVLGAGAIEVRVDGQPLGTVRGGSALKHDVDPGAHVVSVRADGHTGEERTVRVGPGASARVVLRVAPIAHEQAGRSPWPWVGAGAAVAVGAIVAVVLLTRGNSVEPVREEAWGGAIETLRSPR